MLYAKCQGGYFLALKCPSRQHQGKMVNMSKLLNLREKCETTKAKVGCTPRNDSRAGRLLLSSGSLRIRLCALYGDYNVV